MKYIVHLKKEILKKRTRGVKLPVVVRGSNHLCHCRDVNYLVYVVYSGSGNRCNFAELKSQFAITSFATTDLKLLRLLATTMDIDRHEIIPVSEFQLALGRNVDRHCTSADVRVNHLLLGTWGLLAL